MKIFRDFIFYLMGAFGCIVGGMWVSTQSIAKMLHYPIEFGKPLFYFKENPIYSPEFMIWWFTYGDYAPESFEEAAMASMVGALLGTVFILAFAFMRTNRKKEVTSHGTARWASDEEIQASGLRDRKGVFLGQTKDGKYIRHDGPEHILLVAPTGSGKGVSTVIPTLLTWLDSCVVMDIKRENWNYTAGFRQKHLNNVVLKFEPSNPDGSSARFNPLDEIRIRTEHEVKDAQNIVHMLVNPGSGEKLDNGHWKLTAADFLLGVILHLKYKLPNTSLPSVVSFLTQTDIELMLYEMTQMEHTDDSTLFPGIFGAEALEDQPFTHPVVFRAGQKMINTPEKERGSIYSTAVSAFKLYKDPIVNKNIEVSDFCISDLMDYEKPVSLYLVTPPGEIDRLKPLFRMVIDLIFSRLLEPMQAKDGKLVESHKFRLLLLIDEFPALGTMEKIQEALAYIRGYKIKAVLVIQNMNQLYEHYTRNTSIIGNCKVRIYHTPDDNETAKYISDALGTKTEIVENHSYSRSFLKGMMPSNVTVSTQESGRALLTPGEVGQLESDKEIVFQTGYRPMVARKITYYKDERFKKRLMEAPAVSDRIREPQKYTPNVTLPVMQPDHQQITTTTPEHAITDNLYAYDEDFEVEN